jgi:hypothetical protein
MGGTAGAISKTAAAPIERVKLIIQNQGAMLAAGRLDKPYTGIIDCFKRVYAAEGVIACTRRKPCLSTLYSALCQSGVEMERMLYDTFRPKVRITRPLRFVYDTNTEMCSLKLCVQRYLQSHVSLQEEGWVLASSWLQYHGWSLGGCLIVSLCLLS